MTITALPTAPSPSDSPDVFEARITALIAALPLFALQANALEAALTANAHTATSTDTLTIGTGAKSLTVQAGKAWAVGTWLYVINSASIGNYMVGQVTAYNSGTGALSLNVTTVGGSGTAATWALALATPPGTTTGLTGGAAGSLPYQSATNTTAMLAAGTAGQVLQSGGAGAPSWTSTPQVNGFAAGYLGLPPNARTAAYTPVIGDAGKSIPNTTGGWTIPSGVFSAGDTFVLVNRSASAQTITQGSGVTLHQAGSTNTGSRTLAAWGMATVYCSAANEFIVSGNVS